MLLRCKECGGVVTAPLGTSEDKWARCACDGNAENREANTRLLPGYRWYQLMVKRDRCGFCGSPKHKLNRCKHPGSVEFPFSELRKIKS